MVKLIQNIQGNFITEIKGSFNYVKSVEAEIQNGDYINIYGLTGLLQNLSQTQKTNGLSIPNLFGYTPPIASYQQTLDFNTCNKKARWYNMQESPEYLMRLMCGIYPGPTTFTITVESLIVNGKEYINTPLSTTINVNTANWVRANNDIVYNCTGSTTGWTYTDFVDILNYTFASNGLNYEARVSYEAIYLPSCKSIAGFYIIYPENDTFSIRTSSNSGFPVPLTYYNDRLEGAYVTLGYFQTTTDYFTYDCETNIITE